MNPTSGVDVSEPAFGELISYDPPTCADGIESGTHVIVRSTNAGVFAGIVDSAGPNTARLLDARRLWYWDGAATLSDLAVNGVAKPDRCKFPVAVPVIVVNDVIEVIPTSDKAQASIAGVAVWTEH